jgi:deoxyadenosine/deoxycytidine kinase
MQAPTEPTYVAISGLIGAGKSTLAAALGAHMGLPVFNEPVETNPYLALFYGDMKQFAFPLQIYLLDARFKQQQQIVWRGAGGVQDRSIYEDSVFATMQVKDGLMSALDFATYCALFSTMSKLMPRPTLLVYLDVSPDVALERIRERGRTFEAGITLEYLTRLRDEYECFLKEIARTVTVLRIKYDKYRSVEEIAAAIVVTHRENIGRVQTWSIE